MDLQSCGQISLQFDSLVVQLNAMGEVRCTPKTDSFDEENFETWLVTNFSEYKHFYNLQSEKAERVLGRYLLSSGREHGDHTKRELVNLLGKPQGSVKVGSDRVYTWTFAVNHPGFSSDVLFKVSFSSHHELMQACLLLPKDKEKRNVLVGHATRENPMTLVTMQALWFQNSLHRRMGGSFWIDWAPKDWFFLKSP